MSNTTKATWRRLLPSIGSRQNNDLAPHTIHALALLLFLVQLPHLHNLPVWVSATGLAFLLARICLFKNHHSLLFASPYHR